MNLNVDKSQWTKVRLGDVATEYSSRINDPNSGDRERFVGSSCIGQWDFRVQEWESTASVTSAMQLFEEGDYLLVRRSLYASDFRERAPRAHFAGVCSGDILTIRENPEFIADGFLIGILNNPSIWSYIVANASGSITRRIKWKDLANYEFLLPPKDQQAEIAELLWALDRVIEADTELKNTASIHFEVSKNDLTLHGLGNQLVYSEKIKNEVAKGWSVTTVGDLLACDAIVKIQDGNHGEIHPKSSDYIDHGIPFIMANSLENGGVNFSKSKKLPQDITDRLRVGFSYPGDVLLSHKGTIGEVAIVPQEIAFPYLMLTPQVTLYRTNEHKLKGKFLFYVFSAKHFQSQLSVISAQSTRAYVGKTAQQKLRLAIPDSLIEQERIVGFLDELDGLVRLMDDSIAYSRLLQKSLINEVFPI